MRTLVISLFTLVLLSFGAPNIVSAQTCNPACTNGQSCVADDFGNGICVGGSTQLGAGNNQVQVGAGSPNNTNAQLLNPLQGGTLESFVNNILAFVIRIGAIVIVFMVVYVGYKFVVAQGNEAKLSEAKKMLLWTIIGALILLGAQAISLGIQATVQALSSGQ